METKKTSGNWRILLFNGLMALLYAVLAIFASEGLILTIVTYIGILVLLAGAAMLYGVYLNYKNGFNYGNDLIQALLMLFLGILLAFFSQESVKVFVIVVGSWALLIGLSQLYFAFKLPPEMHGKNTMLINSGMTILLGIILLFNPFSVASFMVVISGVVALFVGVLLITLAIKLKNFEP
jgi:uncharacterized membrane protein HdeD (DUF308 family)